MSKKRSGQPEEPNARKLLKWFFKEPKRTLCYTSWSIGMEDAAVYAVLRGETGEWYFLSEEDVNGEEIGYAMSSLGFMVEHYPNVLPLYNLEKKWAAVWDPSTNFWEMFEPDDSWNRFVDRTKV